MNDMIEQHGSDPRRQSGGQGQHQHRPGGDGQMPALAAPHPADKRVDPRQRGDVVVLLANATASLELLGEITGRETDAAVLIKLARESFGG